MTTIVGVNGASAYGGAGEAGNRFSRMVSTRQNKAIITCEMLKTLWRDYPPQMYTAFSKLLEKFEVWVRLANGDYLVPCLLDAQPEVNLFDAKARGDDHTIGRVYVIPFCPYGFFSRLLLRIWSFCRVEEYWNSGAVVAIKDGIALVQIKSHPTPENPFRAQIQILARGSGNAQLVTKIVFTLHSFIQDWYDGLSDHIAAYLPCVECLKQRHHHVMPSTAAPAGGPLSSSSLSSSSAAATTTTTMMTTVAGASSTTTTTTTTTGTPAATAAYHLFEANAFIREYLGSATSTNVTEDTVTCPVCNCKVAVQDMVPEIIGTVDGQGYANDVVEGRSVGVGGFAEVFFGTWRGQEVAIKKLFVQSASLGVEGFTLKTFESFAIEVDMMSRLKHPNVLELKAAYSKPPALVLEYIAMGSLDAVLKGMSGPLDWGLIVRMALDVARGIEYLHSFDPKVLHRDLKSPNILVKSLDVESPVLLKVADLGLSCFDVGRASGKMIENPRWVSPETLLNGTYTEKSDVFSFGIILNELVTRRLPFHEVGWNSEVERRIKNGERPSMMPETLDKYGKLISDCWAHEPSSRPTFKQIVTVLVIIQERRRGLNEH